MEISTKWAIDFSSGVHVYKQIINCIYASIGNGELKEGDKLPTIKELAAQLNINPNTIAKAYRELELKGVITGRRGNGSFVSVPEKKTVKMPAKEKEARLRRMFGRVIAEARSEGIMEDELMEYIWDRRNSYGEV